MPTGTFNRCVPPAHRSFQLFGESNADVRHHAIVAQRVKYWREMKSGIAVVAG